MDNFTMTRVWLIPRAVTGTISHVFLSISDQLCCEIMILSFWVHINTIPNCGIVQNIFWNSVLQDTTTNHTYSFIVVFRNFTNPYLFGPVKDSQRCIISSLIPCEWTWQFFCPIWTYPGLSVIFLKDEYLIWSLRDYSEYIYSGVCWGYPDKWGRMAPPWGVYDRLRFI